MQGEALMLPAGAARHVQVLRLQPGRPVTLFNGEGGEWDAVVDRMGRNEVQVRVGQHMAVEREAAREVHLAIGIPANDRMDWLVEKATELGVASVQPLMTERTVLRLEADRAEKKKAHWQAVAAAACEQCGRNRVPRVHAVAPFASWFATARPDGLALLLSLHPEAQPLRQAAGSIGRVQLLCGPEGGWTAAEEQRALHHGWRPASLGARVLRAETAPLAALGALLVE